MKKVLMAGAALAVILTGAVAVAQNSGAKDGARFERARWSQDDDRGWEHRRGHGHGHHGRWGRDGRHMEGRGMGGRGMGGRGMDREARLMFLFNEVDADKDGSVTTAEIEGFKANRFAAMDANSDGQVDAQELVNFRMLQRAKRQIARMDKNDDGVLSLEELPDRTPPFARFDLDENGVVTQAELDIASKAMGRRMRGGDRPDGERRGGHDMQRGPAQ